MNLLGSRYSPGLNLTATLQTIEAPPADESGVAAKKLAFIFTLSLVAGLGFGLALAKKAMAEWNRPSSIKTENGLSDDKIANTKSLQKSLLPPRRIENEHILFLNEYQAVSECSGDWLGYFRVRNRH